MAFKENPFPGMNPFLLRSWNDAHISFIVYASDALNGKLPDRLRSRVNERHFITTTDDCENRQRYLEVLDASNGYRVVTMIEFLSPSNKVPGEGRDLYLRKREDCQEADVNIVEIDFQRRGLPTTLAASVVSGLTPPPYHVSVWRATDPDAGECYPMPLRETLPVISIPLRREDPDAVLDLQALINLAYRRGRYDASDYRRRPEPPFGEEDEAWISSVVAAQT